MLAAADFQSSQLLVAVAQNTIEFFSNYFTINGSDQQRNENVDTGSNTKIYGDINLRV